MKITKMKTKNGELGSPVTIELDAIVERMRSESTREAVREIASEAHSRLLDPKNNQLLGALGASDRLPRIVFSATFGKGGFDDLRSMTGLLLMDVSCPKGMEEVEAVRKRVSAVPYTVLAFAGSSRRTLKVVMRVAYADGYESQTSGEYLTLLQQAQQTAVPIYQTLAQCELRVQQLSWWSGCRLSHDPCLFYRADAQPLPVVRETQGVLAPYTGAQVEDDGSVQLRPQGDERERLRTEFYTCLQHAIEAHPESDADEALVVTLADYCRKAGLGEEACVKRTLWLSRVRLSEDVVRKIFRAAYAKPYEGKLISQMNEKERIARTIREFMTRRYQLRYNEIKQMVEFRLNDQTYQPWQTLTDRDQKRIAFEEMLEGGHGWSMDIELYVHSSMVPTYNPILEFLGGVGKWDGKHDYIEDFARRLKTDYDRWPHFFHRWFLAMVAQALNKSRDYGNSVVPLLIGPQALKKSSFCRNILPYALREYYMDDIKLDNPEQVERVLSRMWLVNIEEYNAKTEREQAKIKRLLTEKDVQVRKMRSDQYVMKPRLCSFIATTNDSQPLTDPTGSRRYLCVEVTGQADMSGTINYRQMYAQALAELERGDIYWFTNEDEQEITQHNQRHQLMTSVDDILSSLYLPAEHHREFFMTTTDIQQHLRKHLVAADVPTIRKLGLALKRQHYPSGSQDGVHGYYLKDRRATKTSL